MSIALRECQIGRRQLFCQTMLALTKCAMCFKSKTDTSILRPPTFRSSLVWQRWAMTFVVGLMCALFMGAGTVVSNETPSVTEPEGSLRIRLIEVPQEEMRNAPVGELQYRPMKHTRFGRLVREITEHATSPTSRFVRIDRATYVARLDNGQLTQGVGRWEIVHKVDRPVSLSLDNTQLPLIRPRWNNEDKNQFVKFGQSPDGSVVGLIDRTGVLLFDWSLVGRPETGDVFRFNFELAQCPANELILELPHGMIPMVNHGLVQGPFERSDKRFDFIRGAVETNFGEVISEKIQSDSERPALEPRLAVRQVESVSSGFNFWHIELGGRHQVTLHVLPELLTRDSQRLIMAHQSNRFKINEYGVEVEVEIRFDVPYQPLRQVLLDLDSNLRITAAESQGKAVPWSFESAARDAEEFLVIHFPEPVAGRGIAVRLTAFAPRGLAREKLPFIRPRNMLWQEGTAEIRVEKPLEVIGAKFDGCQLFAPLHQSPSKDADILELALFRASPVVDLALAPRRERVLVRQGTSVRFGESVLSGRTVVDVRCIEGERFGLMAKIPGNWVIDSIDAEPPGAITDWTMGKSATARQLRVRLKNSLQAEENPRVIISGHRPALAVGERLSRDDFCFVQFEQVELEDHQVAVSSDVPRALQWQGDPAWRAGKMEALSAAQRSRFGDETSELIFEDNEQARSVSVWFSEQQAQFSVDIQTEVNAGANRLGEIHRMRVTPLYVDRLKIRFSRSVKSPTRWMILGEPETSFEARLLTPENSEFSFPHDVGEMWEIILRRPRRKPFEIQAVRSCDLQNDTFISLLSVTNAEQQVGKVMIRVEGDQEVLIENRNHRLHPIPTVGSRSDQHNSLRAVFRYDPSPHIVAAMTQALVLSPMTSEQVSGRLWLRRHDVESNYSMNGFSRHRVIYQLKNIAARHFQITPHAEGKIRKITINSNDITASVPMIDGNLRIDLPEGLVEITLAVELEHQSVPLKLFDSVEAPIPVVDVPCLLSQWKITLPRGYKPSQVVRLERPPLHHTWRHRLFGHWARGEKQKPFHPLNRSEWIELVNGNNQSEGNSETTGQLQFSMGLPLDSDITPCRSIYDARRLDVVGWACLFATATAVWWFCRSASQLWPVIIAVCAAVALLVPPLLIPVFSRLFMGALLGGLLILFRAIGYQRQQPSRIPSSGSSTVRQMMPTVWSLIVVGTMLSNCRAQTVLPTEPTADSESTYRVFIPVDEQNQVAGEYYSVPEPVYQVLRRFEEQIQYAIPDWIIYRVQYRTRVDWEVTGKRLIMESKKVVSDLETFGTKRQAKLKFHRSELRLPSPTALLDGRSIPIRWTEDGDALEFFISDPGTYRLEFSLVPRQLVVEPFGTWRFEMPCVFDSIFLIDVPPDPPNLEIPGVHGALHWAEQQQQLRVAVGGRDRMSLRWSGGGMTRFSGALDVEQMFWLKVQPRSVVLDAQMTFRVITGKLRMVQLIADSRLRMLPLNDESPIRRVHRHESDASQRLVLELYEPVDEVLTLNLSFLVTETSGIGQIVFPQIKTDGMITRRWLAVSGHENLELTEAASADFGPPVPGPEFVRAWGGTQVEPPRVYDHTKQKFLGPVIMVQPASNEMRVDQRLAVVYGEKRAELRFDVDVQNSGPGKLGHQIEISDDIFVDEVLLSDTDHSIAARWYRLPSGHLNVLLNQWYDGPYRLTMRGHLPIVSGQAVDFPVAKLAEATVETDRVIVGRQNGVSISWESMSRLQSIDPLPNEAFPLGAARIVGAWEMDRTKPFAKVIVNRNTPLAKSVQVNSLISREGVWSLKVDHEVTLQEGFLDEIVFDVPRLVGNPVQIQPHLDFNLSDRTESDRRRLVFHLSDTVYDKYRLQFQLPLTFAPGQRVHVPHVNPLNQLDCTHYVVLPRGGSETIAWDTPWLRPASLPTRFMRESYPQQENIESVYVAIDRDFRAEQPPVDKENGVPQIRQVDIHIYQQASDSFEYTGHVTFDLEPSGMDRCQLRVPPSLRLIHAEVGGLPARMHRAGEAEWDVALSSTWLPHRIEIEYTGEVTPDLSYASTIRFQAPELVDITAQRTLWTVIAPISKPHDQEHSISRSRQQLFRLKTMTELMDLSTQVVGEQTTEDVMNWYHVWVNRYRLERSQLMALGDVSPFSDELFGIESQQSQIAEHLGTPSEWESLERATEVKMDGESRDDRRTLSEPNQVAERATTMMFQGSRYAVDFSTPLLSPITTVTRFAISVLLISFVWWASRRVPVRWTRWIILCARWPTFHGMLIGIAWWLWLVPSWFGLVIIIVLLVTAIGPAIVSRWSQTRYQVLLQRRP